MGAFLPGLQKPGSPALRNEIGFKMKEQHITEIICDPEKAAYTKEIKNNGDTIREILGGLMESHHPFWPKKTRETADMFVLCNEEGKFLDLPRCRALIDDEGSVYDIVHGTFIICAVDRDSGDFCSLSPIQENIAMQLFGPAERYITDADTGMVLVVPYIY